MPKKHQVKRVVKRNPRLPAGSLERQRRNGAHQDKIVILFVAEIRRFISVGRIPLDVAHKALNIADDEICDLIAERGPSWVDNPAEARWEAGDKGLSGEED